jgi:hypothetical protein
VGSAPVSWRPVAWPRIGSPPRSRARTMPLPGGAVRSSCSAWQTKIPARSTAPCPERRATNRAGHPACVRRRPRGHQPHRMTNERSANEATGSQARRRSDRGGRAAGRGGILNGASCPSSGPCTPVRSATRPPTTPRPTSSPSTTSRSNCPAPARSPTARPTSTSASAARAIRPWPDICTGPRSRPSSCTHT